LITKISFLKYRLIPIGALLYFSVVSSILLQATPAGAQTPSYIKNYPSNIYKASPAVYTLVKDSLGLIYFGTNKGVVIFDGTRWETVIVSNFSDVKCLETGPDGKVYVGANSNFGYLENDPLLGFHYISLSDSLPKELTNFNDVWQIVFLNDKIYFQTYSGIFIRDKNEIVFEKANEVFIYKINGQMYGSSYITGEFGMYKNGTITPVKDDAKLKKDMVFQVFPYDEHLYILATSEAGMFLFDDRTKKIKRFKTEANTFLEKYSFYDGLRINPNLYCLGSWSGGMALIDKAGNILDLIDQQSGLTANHIYEVMVGDNHDLWLATSNGISRIALDSLGFDTPQSTAKNKTALLRKIQITNKDNNVEISMPQHTSYTGNQASFRLINNILDLFQNPSSLSLYYAAPCYNGEEISYSVFLDGYDQKWSEWKTEPVKEYTNLQEGNYTFYVQAKKELNSDLSDILSFQINIYSPWYSTIWFKVLIGLLVLFCVFFIIRMIILRLKTQNVRLENLVNERTRDLLKQQNKLSELNKNLKATNTELDSFVYHTSHDLKAPLKSVLGLLDLAKRDDTKGKFLPYHSRMESSILKLEEFISSIVQYSSNSKADVDIKSIDFNEIIKESLNELQYHKNFDKIRFKKKIEIKDAFYSDEKRIRIILNNLLSNAVKYYDEKKEKPEIKIEILQKNNYAELSVEDNGIGIKKEMKDRVFDMFYRASEKSYGSGLGLYIVKETVNKINAEFTMQSNEGEYTIFTIRIPNLADQIKS
jgi:signal transduction histidine kinase